MRRQLVRDMSSQSNRVITASSVLYANPLLIYTYFNARRNKLCLCAAPRIRRDRPLLTPAT
jgi:hypothetical protein